MICPKCGATVPDGPECAACGVVVKKFLARKQAVSNASVPSSAQAADRSSSASVEPALGVAVSAASALGPSSAMTSVCGEAPVRGKLSDRRLAGVYSQLGRMLEAGLSPTEALHLMARATRGKVSAAVGSIRSSLEQGASFAQAAASQPVLFPESSLAILQAGEFTGGLPAALKALASSAEVRMDIKRQIIRACIYPFVLFTLVFFIPKAYLLFTVGLLGYLMACMVPYLTGLGVLISLVWLLPLLLSRIMGRKRTSRLVRAIPGLRGLFRLSSKARFMGHLGAAISSGLPVISCMRLAASATTDPAWVEGMARAENMIKNGSTLHEALDSTGLLDEEMLLSVASGERVGRLEESLAQESSLLRGAFLHRLNISIQILSVSILLATYVFVASAVLGEYEDVMSGTKTQIDQLLKEAGAGQSGDMSKLLKGLGGANGGDLNKLLKGLDGAQGNDLEKLLKELGQPSGASKLPPDLKGILQ